jgi:hypothetical protein
LVWTLVSSAVFSPCTHSKCTQQSLSSFEKIKSSNHIILYSTYGLLDLSDVGEANLSANIVSTLQAGCFFGALGAAPAADKWGRRSSLIGSAVLAIIGIIMQTAASGHLTCMYIGRYALKKPTHLALSSSSNLSYPIQSYHWLRSRWRLNDQPPLRLRKRSARYPRRINRSLSAIHHSRNHDCILDQLRCLTPHLRASHVYRSIGNAGLASCSAFSGHAPVQRVAAVVGETG